MNNELHSLPEALASELQQLVSQITPQKVQSPDEPSIGERMGRLPQPSESPLSRALLHIAQATPEVFVAMVLTHLGITSIEVHETEENYEDRVVKLNNGSYSYSEVQPIVTRKTITRAVRLGTSDRATIGRLR